MTPARSEEGAALLAVLLLVAVMASLSAVALEKMTLSARTSSNAAALDQARAYALGAESFALLRIGDLTRMSPDRTTLAGGWHGNPVRIPLPTGIATATVTDGGNCFNLNSVVRPAPAYAAPGIPGAPAQEGASGEADSTRPDPVLVADARGTAQFVALLQSVGVPTNEAVPAADALADWIDTDDAPNAAGAEDSSYAGQPAPYRTPNRLVVDTSELLAVAGVTPETFAAVRPWLCALPEAKPSPININTLMPEQAPLLAMLLPGQLALADAQKLIAARPPAGWGNAGDLWRRPEVAALNVATEVQSQTVVRTRWFRLRLDLELDGAQMSEEALVDAGEGSRLGSQPEPRPVRLVSRNWGQD